MKDRMQKQDWLDTMVKSLVSKLKLQISLGKTREQAIEIVKEQSTAGAKVWKQALEKI